MVLAFIETAIDLSISFSRGLLLSGILFLPDSLAAAEELPLGPMPISLKQLAVPEVPGLLDGDAPIVVNKDTAIALGKALFWDSNVGSDGMACASCHFHAGADRRVKNQISPVGQAETPSAKRLAAFKANQTLKSADFPLHNKQVPLQENSAVARESDFVVGSAGSFAGEFQGLTETSPASEQCRRTQNSIFHIGASAARQVTLRNAPTVINAIFNQRSFWDGRANNVFNGSSSWGDRDPDAGVWVVEDNSVSKQRLHLINASLASLATAPPLNSTEMSCGKRTLADIGRKLLPRPPLENQQVHWQDSVLGPLSLSKPNALQNGLNTNYESLIKKAFNHKYWSYPARGEFGSPGQGQPYSQIEANFGLFFGLAIQLYQSTLISDQAPFDISRRDEQHQPIDLSPAALRGLEQFRSNLCSHCHLGPNFTAAAVTANAAIAQSHPEAFGDANTRISTTTNVVSRIPVFARGNAVTVFTDTGFASTGVGPESADLGLGDKDIFGNPLSYSLQYLHYLAGDEARVKDQDVRQVRACDFQEPFAVHFNPPYKASGLFTLNDGIQPQPQNTENCYQPADKNAFLPTVAAARAELANPDSLKMRAELKASFKIPTLRNVELTGPYMHNGSMATLDQVVEFYSRGGNFENDAKEITLVFPLPRLKFSEQNRQDLIAFLKTLTDDRVRYQKAPFDHPELKIPHGHSADETQISAQDDWLHIPAVGADGAQEPLQPFAAYLTQD